jgi:hypothetical protein
MNSQNESIGFVGMTLSIDSEYLIDIPIPKKSIVFKLDCNFKIESLEK